MRRAAIVPIFPSELLNGDVFRLTGRFCSFPFFSVFFFLYSLNSVGYVGYVESGDWVPCVREREREGRQDALILPDLGTAQHCHWEEKKASGVQNTSMMRKRKSTAHMNGGGSQGLGLCCAGCPALFSDVNPQKFGR